EVEDDIVYDAIIKAHEAIKPLIGFIEKIVSEIGKPKFEYTSCEIDHVMFDRISDMVGEDVKAALDTDDKRIRDERLKPIYDKVYESLEEDYPDSKSMIDECMYKLQKQIVRRWLLDE
ncbi:MAG TPA: polyribonucleotide nucleotidyltransferase, partial [Clostridiales bacterium]|nr:polyribonucleotide nucleotidyltransferase [Clostridiales bacterium]